MLDDGATFMNKPFADFFAATKLRPEDLWKRQEKRTLLSARLFPATTQVGASCLSSLSYRDKSVVHSCFPPQMDDAVGMATWLQDYAAATDEQVDQWRFVPRLSLAECLEAVDLGGEVTTKGSCSKIFAV